MAVMEPPARNRTAIQKALLRYGRGNEHLAIIRARIETARFGQFTLGEDPQELVDTLFGALAELKDAERELADFVRPTDRNPPTDMIPQGG